MKWKLHVSFFFLCFQENQSKIKAGKCKVAKTKGGAQVFFFPDENHKIEALEQMGMTESIYVQQNYGAGHDDSNEEDFCILDDIGMDYSNTCIPSYSFQISTYVIPLVKSTIEIRSISQDKT